MRENRFNLIDEPWIPIADAGRISLKELFSNDQYKALGGNPVQKLALTKMLLAIVQAADTPDDDYEWSETGVSGMSAKVLAYLVRWYDRFWLYGERPFLQMPAVVAAEKKPLGALIAEVATGNTTVLKQTEKEFHFTDAEKAVLIVTMMGFSLGGKKTDNSVVLSAGYQGKSNAKGRPSTARPGSSVGYMGMLHTLLSGHSVLQTLWLNTLTLANISSLNTMKGGVGNPPWEVMPLGEDDEIARNLQSTYIGRLVPMNRFCLLTGNEVHYSEGIAHSGYADGVYDPTIAVDYKPKKPRVIWVSPDKRPWREVTALLAFFGGQSTFDCAQLRFAIPRCRTVVTELGIWSGGLRVSSNAGEQYVSGSDDYVESQFLLQSSWLGEAWFVHLEHEMEALETVAKQTYGATMGYCKELKVDGKDIAAQTTHLFWELVERDFQKLIEYCDDPQEVEKLRQKFAGFSNQAFNRFCSRETARQLDAWAANRPNLFKYLNSNKEKKAA